MPLTRNDRPAPARRLGACAGAAALAGLVLSGCLATRDDLTGLQERMVRVETQLTELEKENRQARASFEAEWTRRLASLSEDILTQRERIAGTEGSVQVLGDQVRREAERAENFRTTTGQELAEYQRGLSARLDNLQEKKQDMGRDLAEMNRRAEATGEAVALLQAQARETREYHEVLAALITERDESLQEKLEQADRRVEIMVEEIIAETDELRRKRSILEEKLLQTADRLAELEKTAQALEEKTAQALEEQPAAREDKAPDDGQDE